MLLEAPLYVASVGGYSMGEASILAHFSSLPVVSTIRGLGRQASSNCPFSWLSTKIRSLDGLCWSSSSSYAISGRLVIRTICSFGSSPLLLGQPRAYSNSKTHGYWLPSRLRALR